MVLDQTTTHQQSAGGHDAPIFSPTEDLLGASKIAKAIHRTILNAPKRWSTRIGLYGTWGSGKTSVLNLLERLEIDDDSIVVRYSAWSAVSESGVLRLLYSELTEQLQRRGIKAPKLGVVKSLAGKAKGLGRLGKFIGRGAEAAGQLPPGTSDAVAGVAESAFSWLSIDRHDIDKLVSQLAGRRVTIFIDDLDRADPRLIPKTLLALRELLDWPGFSFVLAFDRKVVARALAEYSVAYGENAQTFLEKVIDITFEMTVPNEAQKLSLATQAFSICCPFFPNSALLSIKQHLPNEGRRIKLIARKIGVLKRAAQRHDSEEIDWHGLGLYQIIHEASPDTASFVVEVATSKETNWNLWAGDKAEKEASEAALRSEIEKRILASNSPNDERVISAALQLVAHWAYTSEETILQLVSLVFEEPSFTRKEVSHLIAEWDRSKDPSMVIEAIKRGAEFASINLLISAQDLLVHLITLYDESLSHMADSELDAFWQRFAKEARTILSLLEHFWLSPTAVVIQEASRTGIVSSHLVRVITRWVGWDKNSSEKPLREREKVLGLKAASQSDALEQIYSDTDPYWNRANAFGDVEKGKWIDLIRSTLDQPVCERLIARFSLPGELSNIVRNEETLSIWLLESVKSPLYREQMLARKLADVLREGTGASGNEMATKSENARTYLHLLLGQARNASWGGKEKISEIHGRYPEIIQSAWSAVISCRVPFRMASSIVNLRNDLITAGIPSEQLVTPTWLVALLADSAPTDLK